MKAQPLIPCGLLLFAALFAAFAAPRLSAQQSSSAAVTPRIKQIYQVDCAFCHGDTGNGKTDAATSMNLTMMDWTDPKALSSQSDQQIFTLIRNGKDKMPPEDTARAKDAEIYALIGYIRSFAKGQAAATPPTGTK